MVCLYSYLYLFIIHHHILQPLGWRISCNETSNSRREAKLKREEKEIFLFMLLSCRLGHRQTSTFQGLHMAMATHNCGISSKTRVHPPVYALCILLYKPLPFTCIIHDSPCLPDIQTIFFNIPSLKQSTSSSVDLLSNYSHTPLHTSS